MRTTLVTMLLCIATQVQSETLLVSACKRAINHWYFSENINFVAAQDFSNLKPPRARVKTDNMMSSTHSCVFRSATSPTGIVEFCNDLGCYKAGHQMFDEIAELLKREGL